MPTELAPPETNTPLPQELLSELRLMIDQTRKSIASTVNASLTLLYWQVGERIQKETLAGGRAEYGHKIIATVSRQLKAEYGNSFSEKNLRRMIQFAQVFPDKEIVVLLIRQLSWTHFIALIPIKEALKRDFYAEMCRLEGCGLAPFFVPLAIRGSGWFLFSLEMASHLQRS